MNTVFKTIKKLKSSQLNKTTESEIAKSIYTNRMNSNTWQNKPDTGRISWLRGKDNHMYRRNRKLIITIETFTIHTYTHGR